MVATCFLAAVPIPATPLPPELSDPGLTPKRFAAYFEDFEDEIGVEVQTPAEFLSRRRGDCDDYAILADHVLRQRGYDTRLVHVRMVGRIAHAICYVFEDRAYLDYNNRKFFFTLQRCGPTLREIATKVADWFEANWTSVSEFTYDYETEQKRFRITIVKTAPPESDQDRTSTARRNRDGK